MSDRLVMQFIGEVKKTLTQHAEDAMILPKPSPFEHGLVAGEYRGLQRALDILDDLMRDINDKDDTK